MKRTTFLTVCYTTVVALFILGNEEKAIVSPQKAMRQLFLSTLTITLKGCR